jgi:toxin ParE1/3/4
VTGCYVLSPRARSDLDDIWNYTEHRWGIDQAELYIRQLREQIEAVAAQPAIGRACFEIRAGYYKYRARSLFLFYRLTSQGIDIIRILHERMDFEQHLQ